MTDAANIAQSEQKALTISKWANLFMAAAGISAAWLSNSQALMVDGLFSLIGFCAAIIGTKVSANAAKAPDRLRPFGYAAEESVFMTFRALSLLGLVIFSATNAGLSIASYASSGEARELNYPIIATYLVVIMATCASLAFVHKRAWRRTGKTSSILKLEGNAAVFDGLMTVAAAAGLMAFPLLRGTSLDFLVPVGDSIVVLLLCLLVVGQYWAEFRLGLAELAGATAKPETLLTIRRTVRDAMADAGGMLVDVAAVKTGRQHTIVVFWDPPKPVSGSVIDGLTDKIVAALDKSIGKSSAAIVVSKHGRTMESPTESD